LQTSHAKSVNPQFNMCYSQRTAGHVLFTERNSNCAIHTKDSLTCVLHTAHEDKHVLLTKNEHHSNQSTLIVIVHCLTVKFSQKEKRNVFENNKMT